MTRRKRTQFCPAGHDTFLLGRTKHHGCKKCIEGQVVKRTQNLIEKAGRPKPGFCELCGAESMVVFDHDHKTGSFRGWICSNCNLVLGLVKDNPRLLQQMINYLGVKNEAHV